jgi:hypothetical protein
LAYLTHIGAIDWILEFRTMAEDALSVRTAEALFALASLSGSRLFLEPLMDFDRTMDITCGLLDRLCNPRKLFHLVRSMNTVLFSRQETYHSASAFLIEGIRVMALEATNKDLLLIAPDPLRKGPDTVDLSKIQGVGRRLNRIDFAHLEKGTLEDLPCGIPTGSRVDCPVEGPKLLVLHKNRDREDS